VIVVVAINMMVDMAFHRKDCGKIEAFWEGIP